MTLAGVGSNKAPRMERSVDGITSGSGQTLVELMWLVGWMWLVG